MINFISVGGIIADIAVIAIFAFSIFRAYRRGLTLLIYSLVATVVTVVLLLILYKPVTNFIIANTNVDETISEKIETTLENAFSTNFEEGELIEGDDTNISASVVNMINSYIAEAQENAVENVSEYVADQLSIIVVSAVVAIVLCIVIRLLAILFKFVLLALANLPIIHTLDKSGGVVYGILRAYLIVYFLLAILSLLSPVIANTGLIAYIKNSHICSIFYNNNILLKIFG